MASREQMTLNKIDRMRRGLPAQTKSRMARNRKRNYVKELKDGRN